MNVPPQHQPGSVSSCLPPQSEFLLKLDENALALVPLKKKSPEVETPEVGSESPAGLSLTSACSGTQTHLHSPLAPGVGG